MKHRGVVLGLVLGALAFSGAVASAKAAKPETDVERFVKSHWRDTVRVHTRDEGTLIGLPKPYTVPCIADSFQELYYWDTYFTNVGLLRSGMVDQARNNCEDIAFLIGRYGFMPNGSRTWYLHNSQPPFFTRMVAEVFAATGDTQWLQPMYDAAEKEYEFWISQRTVGNQLARHYRQAMTPAEMKDLLPWWWDRVSILKIGMPTDAPSIERWATTFRAIAESGWDCTSRFIDWWPQHKNPIDLNSLLYGMECDLEKFATVLGKPEAAARWHQAAAARKARIVELMWDEKAGRFCDYDFTTGERSAFVSCAQFYPLFAGIATPEQARRTHALLPKLECAYGVACSENSPGLGGFQWDYPNGWACLQYVVVKGLLRYGYVEDARRLAAKYVKLVDKVYAETGDLWEKYDVVKGEVSVNKEYKSPKMLGWTAGVYLALKEIAK